MTTTMPTIGVMPVRFGKGIACVAVARVVSSRVGVGLGAEVGVKVGVGVSVGLHEGQMVVIGVGVGVGVEDGSEIGLTEICTFPQLLGSIP